MPPLYIVQQGAKIRVRNQRLQVELEGETDPDTLISLPLSHVSEVVLFGNIGLTTPAIDCLLGEDIQVVFLSSTGEYRGRLNGPLSPHVPLRRAQYRCLDQPVFILQMARGFVRAKLEHQRAMLQRRFRERPDPDIEGAVLQQKNALAAVDHKTALSSLRGLEGSATAAYFGAYRRLFAPDWRFTSRLRRPPPDPVNVLLSLGYTLMSELTASAVQAVGLDPYAGFLHEYVYNRPALGLDLLEEFRPVVDGIVLWACRGGQITPADFSPGPPERPVVLSEAGLKRFLRAFEQRMEQPFTHPLRGVRMPLRQCLLEQARQVAACIQSGQAGFQGMGFR